MGEKNNGFVNNNYTTSRRFERLESESRSNDEDTFSSSSSMKISYSVNSQSDYGFAMRSVEKSGKSLSFVQQMRLKFENIESELQYKPPTRFIPEILDRATTKSPPTKCLPNEVPSEDEVDNFGESECIDDHAAAGNFKVEVHIPEISVDEIKSDCKNSESDQSDKYDENDNKDSTLRLALRPFSEPAPEATNRFVVYKSHSCKERKQQIRPPLPSLSDNQNDSQDCFVINELITTEESYVCGLKRGIENYTKIYDDQMNLPANLRGKKYFLFGNIEQIVQLHENELLPMLTANRNDVIKICKGFHEMLMENRFYGYVLYAINKSNSERICIEEKIFFKQIQENAGDKLGIDSFLVQPIQRLSRYHLFFDGLIKKYLKRDVVKFKNEVGECCKVEKHMHNFLKTVNSAMQINDVQGCNDINLLYQGCFKQCFDLTNYDHGIRRTYKCRLFIFERSVVYTEIIKDKKLIYRGFYPRERIGIDAPAGKKSFSLFYQKRKVQQCDFSGDSTTQDQFIDFIKSMMESFGREEKEKIQQKYQRFSGVFRRPQPRLELRNPSRLSTDSGVASVYSNGSNNSDDINARTTWYADTLVASGV